MSVWYYDAGGVRFRVAVGYTLGRPLVDRLDLYEDASIKAGWPHIQERLKSESLEMYERRRTAWSFVGDISSQ